jgi:hypothetical protein
MPVDACRIAPNNAEAGMKTNIAEPSVLIFHTKYSRG